jgi:Spy/CpxP family protein refolding chaperone
MKRVHSSILVVGVMICCLFSSSSLQAQEGFPQPLDLSPQFLAQASPQEAPQNMRANQWLQPQAQGEFGGVRLNWAKLGLSQKQKVQIAQKRREFQVNTAALREKLKFAEQDLRAELEQDQIDRGKIDALLSELSSLKQELSEAAVQNLLDIKSVLTPEQQEKLAGFQHQLPQELQVLRLSAEQRSHIQEIMRNAITQNREASDKLHDLREELQQMLLASEAVDSAKLSQIQDAIAEHDLAIEKARVEMFIQIKDVLTPEQQKRYQKLRSRRKTNPEQSEERVIKK